jgi:hypothetical protein
MKNDEFWDSDLVNHQFVTQVREGIDMTDEEVRTSRLAINALLAEMNFEPKDRAHILHILGLANDDEFRPEFEPTPPVRMCQKKLHDIGHPSKFRIRKTHNIFGDDRVCLACEAEAKESKIRANQARASRSQKAS